MIIRDIFYDFFSTVINVFLGFFGVVRHSLSFHTTLPPLHVCPGLYHIH